MNPDTRPPRTPRPSVRIARMTFDGARNGRDRPVGRHLPTSGGLIKTTLARAEEQGCETVQVFVSNPQGWSEPPEKPEAEDFLKGVERLGISPVVVHAKYLINLASRDEGQRAKSVEALARELVAAGAIGAEFVVVHSGSHGGEGEDKGLDLLSRGLVAARERAEGLSGGGAVARPVVENSCGAGTQLCYGVDALAQVVEAADAGTCIDTCHAFVAGYDLSGPGGAADFAGELMEKLSGRVSVIHFNDAKNGYGSHRDGHARIGEGGIPLESWGSFFGGLPGVPVVMETPYDTPEVDAKQVWLAKKLAGGLRVGREGI